jgi:nucleotide-binding universal stress UspA family protein
MTIASVLAIVGGPDSSSGSLQAGLLLGRRFSCRVDFLHIEPDVMAAAPIVGEGMSASAIEQVMASFQAEADARSKAARGLFDSYCQEQKLQSVQPDDSILPGSFQVSFRQVVARESYEVTRRGRLADVIVLARPKQGGDVESVAGFDAALFDSGRPVVLVPAEPVAALGDSVAIAWNRSREAARAVAAALPVLRQAGRVFVLTARESDDTPEPSELARYLGGHGIEVKTWAFTPDTGPIGDALVEEARKAGADLLVMGAYGHSRLRETVLGGATRDVLRHGVLPVMLAH